ncbi:PP2C family protein-serine/threonine phosphatase [Curtobacterium sp. VKM Ac-1393]|uniref:PP2C family protein-serine/threonine phosphatase n=1 Tax=Curtobacterium sp. VKM Ac-1393 TaxID=2783814 RepID=UPI00188D090B|nr:SpoIIE family protein phosphatase [Curtobacterium sp. VKM Ac-1393]MBF4606535.1 SpoIIE family protein phosphatase [Curtobacterium sp. VKM Ac-1393]
MAPLVKQAVVAGLISSAAVASTLTPWLPVTEPVSMWTGVVCALLALVCAGLMTRWPLLIRWELLLPAVDFIAVGLLRYGTGESRSVFLAIVVLPVIWIAANPGRRHIVYPLIGTSVTLLLPFVVAPGPVPGSEAVRLLVAVLVYAAAATVTNELARRATLRLDVSQRQRRVMESEIVQAELMQQALLPSDVASLPAQLEAVGMCLPAKRVGGDFYDWFPTKTGAAFTLGDVMGKGVAAGMIAAAVRSVIRSTVDDTDAAHGLRRAAAGIATGGSDLLSARFTTCFHLRVDRDGTAQWADAGHGLTILRRADGTQEPLRSADLPLGIGTSWTSATTTLAEGDAIVSISDGVLDLFGTGTDTFDRFAALLGEQTAAAAIVDEIAALAATSDHPDDVTVLVVTYRTAASADEGGVPKVG